jgi:hypothetical protein
MSSRFLTAEAPAIISSPITRYGVSPSLLTPPIEADKGEVFTRIAGVINDIASGMKTVNNFGNIQLRFDDFTLDMHFTNCYTEVSELAVYGPVSPSKDDLKALLDKNMSFAVEVLPKHGRDYSTGGILPDHVAAADRLADRYALKLKLPPPRDL